MQPKMKNTKMDRRNFLMVSVGALAAIRILGFQNLSWAKPAKGKAAKEPAADKPPGPLPAGETAAPETDPVPSAIGYKVNGAGEKRAAKDDFCKTCALYTKLNDDWGKCQMINPGVVRSTGWCRSFNKKS